jgi:predicted permease
VVLGKEGITMVRDLLQDVRHGARRLLRSPASTAVVVTTLALGIGANAAIFTLINAVLLRPLPVREPGRLVLFTEGNRQGRNIGLPAGPDGSLVVYSHPLYQRLRGLGGLQGLAGQDSISTNSIVLRASAAAEGLPERADGRCVTTNFFTVLGVDVQRGRTFGPEDKIAPGANPVVILSDGYWRRRFAGDPAVLGQRLLINDTSYTVVGIAAAGFTGAEVGTATDFWVPLTMQAPLTREPPMLGDRKFWWMHLIGRLAPDGDRGTVEAAANVIVRQFLAEDPALKDAAARGRGRVTLLPGAVGMSALRQSFRQPLIVLMVAVGLLMVIVCLNLGHLLLARAMARQGDVAIRAALGASRGRLIRQMLVEGLLLASVGMLAGALLSHVLGQALIRLSATALGNGGATPPLALDVSFDRPVLAYIIILFFVVVGALGLLPAWQVSRPDLVQALGRSDSRIAGGSRRLISRVLLVLQVAFSIVLLTGAGVLVRTLDHLREVPTGFDARQVLLVNANVAMLGLRQEAALLFYDDLVRRTRALPGVRNASLSSSAVMSDGRMRWGIDFPGTAIKPLAVEVAVVTAGYFDTLGMRLAAGRGLAATDRAGARRVAVVNQAMARRAFGDGPLGRTFRIMNTDNVIEVVGVLEDARIHNQREPPLPTIYLPPAQPPGIPGPSPTLGQLQVGAFGDPALLTGPVRRTIAEAKATLPVLSVRTARTQLEWSLGQERLLATLSTVFGLGALLLVAIGLYGVISQWASQRDREIAVRMALGATAGRVRWLVLRQALLMVLTGVVLGLPAAAGASRLLASLVFGIRPIDPASLLVAALAITAVALVAAHLPARRASRTAAMTVLRGG